MNSALVREGRSSSIVRLDKIAERRLLLNPQLALGEVYMDGHLTIEQGDIVDLMSVLTSNLGLGFGGHWAWINTVRFWLRRFMQSNTLARAKNNVAHHYDLSAGLYDLLLDSKKQYSCVYFDERNTTLEAAQTNSSSALCPSACWSMSVSRIIRNISTASRSS